MKNRTLQAGTSGSVRGEARQPTHPLGRRRFLRLAAGAAVLPVIPRIARAQAYPTRPITMLVPFPAGGGTDAVARTIADTLRTSLGQTVIIENLAGASGTLGVGRGARAAGDGYTLVTGGWDAFGHLEK